MIKFCKTCKSNGHIEFGGTYGYYWCWLDTVHECKVCGSAFEDIDFPALDLKVLTQISQDVNFIEAMIKLRQDDIIEYESRMSQFRMQAEQKEQIEQQKQESTNQVKCPTCGSTNVQKIGAVERTASVIGLGIFSKKINKSFKCKNCGYTW